VVGSCVYGDEPQSSVILERSFKLKEIGCHVMDWIQLVQDKVKWLAVMKTVMNVRRS
jgi:hypothetical protein